MVSYVYDYSIDGNGKVALGFRSNTSSSTYGVVAIVLYFRS